MTNSRLFITAADKPMIQMRGLSYKATVTDIREFLGPELCSELAEEVQLIANKEGRPSGFARLTFKTHQGAKRCRDERHFQLLLGRYVEMFFFRDTGEGGESGYAKGGGKKGGKGLGEPYY